MAVDAYTHDSYTLMKPTALLQEAVEHVLSLKDGEASPESLRRELQAWPGRGKEKEEEEDGIETVDASVLVSRGLEFEVVRRVHQELERHPMGEGGRVSFVNPRWRGFGLVPGSTGNEGGRERD